MGNDTNQIQIRKVPAIVQLNVRRGAEVFNVGCISAQKAAAGPGTCGSDIFTPVWGITANNEGHVRHEEY